MKQLTKANISLDVANNGLEAIEKIQQAQVQGLPFNTCLMDGEFRYFTAAPGREADTELRRDANLRWCGSDNTYTTARESKEIIWTIMDLRCHVSDRTTFSMRYIS